MARIWLNDASSGGLALPDGRTLTISGTVAKLSDGTSIPIGGKGFIDVPDLAPALLASSTALSLTRASGTSTTANVSVSGAGTTPTGTVTIFINGVQYTQSTLVNGQASVNLPTSAFTNGSGNYTITAQYNGDSTYSPSTSAPQTFFFTAP